MSHLTFNCAYLLKKIKPEYGDILLSRYGTVGEVRLVRTHLQFQASYSIAIIKPSIKELSKYITVILQSQVVQSQINQYVRGVTQLDLGLSHIRKFDIPLPPLFEQERILSKLEELFSKLDAGIAALERVQANLKRYRAAVLKAAVEGKLTEEWRKQNPNTEPASKLLQRILKERRQKWESEQLEKYQKSGKTPPKDWQSKYKEPSAPDTANLPSLPNGWCWATVEMLAKCGVKGCIEQGWSPQCERVTAESDSEWGVITTTAVQSGAFVDSENKKLPITLEPRIDLEIVKGDLLITRAGPRSRVAIVCLVKDTRPRLILCDKVYRLKLLDQNLVPEFVESYLQSSYAVKCLNNMKTGISESGVNLTQDKFLVLQVPLPSLSEQKQIVNEINCCLSKIDNCKELVDINIIRSKRLKQAILKQAFSGKLVPQDPNDEPASVLLQRIQAEKANTSKAKPAKRQPKRKVES